MPAKLQGELQNYEERRCLECGGMVQKWFYDHIKRHDQPLLPFGTTLKRRRDVLVYLLGSHVVMSGGWRVNCAPQQIATPRMRAKTILPADSPNSPEMQLQIIWACFRSSEMLAYIFSSEDVPSFCTWWLHVSPLFWVKIPKSSCSCYRTLLSFFLCLFLHHFIQLKYNGQREYHVDDRG